MTWRCHRQSKTGGSAPATPGFNAVAPEWLNGAADAAPAVPAAESTLGSHPCVALSSAQVFPEWTTSTPLCNTFSTDGDYPLNFVSHDWGSLQNASVLDSLKFFVRRLHGDVSVQSPRTRPTAHANAAAIDDSAGPTSRRRPGAGGTWEEAAPPPSTSRRVSIRQPEYHAGR